ncbi:MAG: hypothetical protein JXB36_16970, partial [Gammaproteobacteria bacterium]|nr:hypothetical protein [Gammaproteobacteria bacterium]
LRLYGDLQEQIEDARLNALLHEALSSQSKLLRDIVDARRALGDLPQAGDPERSHLGAAGAHLRAMVLPGSARSHYVETLLEAAAGVSAELDAALAIDLAPQLKRLLEAFRESNAAFVTALRNLGPD